MAGVASYLATFVKSRGMNVPPSLTGIDLPDHVVGIDLPSQVAGGLGGQRLLTEIFERFLLWGFLFWCGFWLYLDRVLA